MLQSIKNVMVIPMVNCYLKQTFLKLSIVKTIPCSSMIQDRLDAVYLNIDPQSKKLFINIIKYHYKCC